MILADKIIYERKKLGWSQEELAEKLNVSRQSVSKWEGAQAVPDLNRILEMASLFGVSTDYLLKEDMEPEDYVPELVMVTASDTVPPRRKLTLEEASEYIHLIKKNNMQVSLATALFVLSPVILIALAGCSEEPSLNVSENLAVALGMVSLLFCIAIGVVLWVLADSREKEYKFIEKGDFESEYGVESVVMQQKKAYAQKNTMLNIIAIVLCIFCAVPMIIAAVAEAADIVVLSMFCLLLIIVAAATAIFVYNGRINKIFENILEKPYESPEERAKKQKLSHFCSAYWCFAVTAFLFIGFVFNKWQNAYIYWPIVGVGFAACLAIYKANNNISED